MTAFINLPGIGGSDAGHWQTAWEASDTRFSRIAPGSWDEPRLDDWIEALDRSAAAAPSTPILVAHSLGCLLVAHWAARRPGAAVAGVFLVGVPDPNGPASPPTACPFRP
jgi:uncharacterized protein